MRSVYSPKLNGLLYKQLDRDEMNAIGRLYVQLSYSWMNNFLEKKISGVVRSIYSPNLKGLLYKRVDKDKTNGIGRLYMQLRYLWLNSFVSKNQYSTIHEFIKIERLADKTAR